jgi:hypothetical protein
MISWPRGRYNGQRIEGFEIKIQVHVLWWRLHFHCKFGELAVFIGPITVRISAMYEWRR